MLIFVLRKVTLPNRINSVPWMNTVTPTMYYKCTQLTQKIIWLNWMKVTRRSWQTVCTVQCAFMVWSWCDLVCGWCDSANTWFLCTFAYTVSAHRQSWKRCCLTWNHDSLLNMQSSMLVRPLKTGRHRNAYRSYLLSKCTIFGKKILLFFFWTVCDNCSVFMLNLLI